MTDQQRIRVLFVEDHRLLADSLSALLRREPDIAVVGIAGSVAEAKELARNRLDVVLMDYQLPDGTGAEATRAIKARWPAARVIMVTALTDDETVLESIQAGADGYLTKDRAAEEVVLAVRAAFAGETLLPRSVIAEIARRVALSKERTDEREVGSHERFRIPGAESLHPGAHLEHPGAVGEPSGRPQHRGVPDDLVRRTMDTSGTQPIAPNSPNSGRGGWAEGYWSP